MFLPRTQCILEWPISNFLNNDKPRGYNLPLSHEIVDTPTKTPCPPPDFYLELGSNVVGEKSSNCGRIGDKKFPRK